MNFKNWIVLGIAVSAILAYTVGIPPSISAEYTKSAQYTSSANSCGNTQGDETQAAYPFSDYDDLVDNPSIHPLSQVNGNGSFLATSLILGIVAKYKDADEF